MLQWLTDGEPTELFLSSSPSAPTKQHFFQVLSRVAVVLKELPLGKPHFFLYCTRSAFLARITAFLVRIGVFLAADRCFPSGGLMFSGVRNNQTANAEYCNFLEIVL